jgi:hypothetical protein
MTLATGVEELAAMCTTSQERKGIRENRRKGLTLMVFAVQMIVHVLPGELHRALGKRAVVEQALAPSPLRGGLPLGEHVLVSRGQG